MYPYWLLYGVAAIPAMIASGRPDERKNVWGAMVLALLIILFVGLRYEVGGDWVSYIEIFQEIRYTDVGELLTSRADVGFAMLNKFVLWLGADYWLVNLICAIIFTIGLFRFALHLPNPWLAIAVAIPYLVIVVGMGYTRQAVALGLIMIGLVAIAERSFPRFLFWSLFAITFHRTALIIIPIAGMAYAQNRLVVLISATVFTIAAYYFFLASLLELLLTNYVDAEYQSSGALVRALMNLVPAILYLLTMRQFPIDESARKLWRNFAILSILTVLLVLVFASTTIVDRLALYLIPLQLFVFSWLPSIFSQSGRPDRKLVVAILAYSAVVLYVWLFFAAHSSEWLPYRVFPVFPGMSE